MKSFSAAIFVLALLIFGTGMIGPMVAEARECESESQSFEGLCIGDTNCESICKTEGFEGGSCSGFRRRCMCTKHCED